MQVHDELARAKELIRELKLRVRQLTDELEAREARRASTSSAERMRLVEGMRTVVRVLV